MKFTDYSLFGVSAALESAIACGLLDALWQGGGTSADLARRASCDPEASDRVLDVLVAVGMLSREGARYAPSPRFREAVGRGPGGWPAFRALWAHTPTFLRKGTRFGAMDGSRSERAQAYSRAVSGLGELFEGAAALLSTQVPARQEILDVGAGSGVWSLAMLAKSPTARATALDFEAVLPNFRARAAGLGLGERTSAFAADYHELHDLPWFALAPRFDRVVLANVLHLESEAEAEALVSRCARLVVPGGDIVIVDVLDELGQEIARAAYGLHLAMRTQGGRAHPGAFLRTCLGRAGCGDARLIDLSPEIDSLGALLATRRGA